MGKNAKLIVLEGCDASGKSTQIELIKKYFKTNNLKYEYIHFPIYGDNEASNVIAAYLRGEYGNANEVNPVFVANMYAMDRYLYLPKLNKQLIENDVVLLDRYVFSNMAYQGAKYKADAQSQIIRDWINEYEFGFLELPYPDLNLFLDVPIEYIENRLKERLKEDRDYLQGKTDIHEADFEFQRRVRQNYLSLIGYEGFKVIECAEKIESKLMWDLKLFSPEEVFFKYQKYLDHVLFNKPVL